MTIADDELCCDYVVTGVLQFVEQHAYGGFVVVDTELTPVAATLPPGPELRRGGWVRLAGSLHVDPYYWSTNLGADYPYDVAERSWRVGRIWGARRGADDPDDPERLVLTGFEEIDAVPEAYVGGREHMPAFRLRLEPRPADSVRRQQRRGRGVPTARASLFGRVPRRRGRR